MWKNMLYCVIFILAIYFVEAHLFAGEVRILID